MMSHQDLNNISSLKLVKMSCILLDGVDGKGVGGHGDGVGWREYFCVFKVLFFCFLFLLSVVRAYHILAYATIVSV